MGNDMHGIKSVPSLERRCDLASRRLAGSSSTAATPGRRPLRIVSTEATEGSTKSISEMCDMI